ncbi:MAG: hypothetical protein HN952_03150 [Candidatus Cloacimonetes bacterium]|nr:hypothetical protein [Candidatus Cloacimonadota bacterium]
MTRFLEKIKKQQLACNAILITKFLIFGMLIFLLTFILFFFIFNAVNSHQKELFLFAVSMKVFLALVVIYLVLQLNRTVLSKFETAKKMDYANNDKSDTYQNAFELFTNKQNNIVQKIVEKANKQATQEKIKYELKPLKNLSFLTIFILSSFFIVAHLPQFSETYSFFSMRKLPPIQHKNFIELTPQNLQILRESDIVIEVQNPENVEHILCYKIEKKWREITLRNFRKKFEILDYSFDYFVKTPFAISDTFRIEVFELPIVKKYSIRYDFPQYTKQKSLVEKNANGHIKAVFGTIISLEIVANNPLKTAHMIFSNGDILEMQRMGKSTFKIDFEIQNSGYYHINLIDILDNKSQQINKQITAISDEMPSIDIIQPGCDTMLTQNMLQSLKIVAADDFGLQDLTLKYVINFEDEFSENIKKSFSSNIISVDYNFDLNEMVIIPGDKINYWVEIYDNSPSKQKGISPKYVLRFPSMEEIYREIEREEKAKSEILHETLEKSAEIQEKFEEKRREVFKKDEVNWEDKKEIEELFKEQTKLNEDVEKVAQDFQELMEKFEDNKALSSETLEKMAKIQELMEDISNEELQKAMEELQKAMEDLDADVMQKAMENFKFSMEDFSSKLEQTIKLLEEIKKEQSLQKALEIAEEMEKMQNILNEQTETGDLTELSKRQKDISQKLENLKEQIQNSKEMMNSEEDASMLQKFEELQEMMQSDSLQNDLQNSEMQLQNDEKQKAQNSQQSASQKMSKITEKLESMQQMMSAGMQIDASEILDKTIRRLLIFSNFQEDLSKNYDDDPYLIIKDEIAVFEGINRTLKELFQTPMIILVIGPKFMYDTNFTSSSFREMFIYINDAKTTKVKNYLLDIRKGLNLMIFDLMQAKENMQDGSGGGMQSMMQMMQQMGQQQMMMNMMTQSMMQQMGENGKMGNEARRQAQKLANDQQRLAENLKRMLQTNQEAQKQTAAINKMIEELESIVNDLNMGRVNQELIEKQERILSRLLEAQKSIHKREFSKKRKAENSEIDEWDLPENLELEFDKMWQKALLNEDYKSYPKEYQELVKEYLKMLNEKLGEK